MTYAELLPYFIIYGPLGLWAGIATFFLVKKDKKHDATRDVHESAFQSQASKFATLAAKQAEDYSERLDEKDAEAKAASGDFADRLEKLSDDFAKKLERKDETHSRQLNELTEKFVELVRSSVAENKSLTDQVQVLIAVLSRKR